eukprot:gene12440-biopygen7938
MDTRAARAARAAALAALARTARGHQDPLNTASVSAEQRHWNCSVSVHCRVDLSVVATYRRNAPEGPEWNGWTRNRDGRSGTGQFVVTPPPSHFFGQKKGGFC